MKATYHIAGAARLPTLAAIACIFLCSFVFAPHTHAQEPSGPEEHFASIALPRGTELPILVSKQAGSRPNIAVLLFAGYPGILHIRSDDGSVTYDLHGNFLIRARRHLLNDQIFTVMVDCPKDQWVLCDDRYRTSDQHAQDIAAVIDKVKSDFGATKVYVMGTSYGTVSSAFLALKLTDKIDGAIHTATFTDPDTAHRGRSHGLPMGNFDWTAIKVDQLFVHHKDDPCSVTRYRSVVSRKGIAPLITVQGSKNAHGNVCEAFSAHGFVGRERITMLAIADWIASRKVQEIVGDDESED
jgi:pimeloyl-ACP methyl ester carboxylesterase